MTLAPMTLTRPALPTGVGLGSAFASPRRTIGAVDVTNPRLTNAAAALYAQLQSAGCQQGYVQEVYDFQAAWLAAGGTLPQDTGGRSPVDGLYGANTQSALAQIYPDAPPGCVAPVTGGGGAITPTTASFNLFNLSSYGPAMAAHPWITALILIGAVGFAYHNWHHQQKRHGGGHPRRRRRLGSRRRAHRRSRRRR